MKVKRQVLLFLLALLPMVASAYGEIEIDGIYYQLDRSAHVTSLDSYNSYSGAIVIPSSVTYNGNTYIVTSIVAYAFKDCTYLTSVTIPNSVTAIGSYAFSRCWSLTSITIPNSVTDIGWNAFENCSSLTSITISNSLTSIWPSIFSGCSSLTSITIPNSVTEIGWKAFENCSSLTSITIPNSVTRIGPYAFSGCLGLTSITIPNSVTSIDSLAFSGCSGLTSITIPNSVASIGEKAFSGCAFVSNSFINNSKLTNDTNWGATICDEETNDGLLIKDNSVVRCRHWATSATIPNRVISIGNGAFSKCWSLTSITIPNSVASIGNSAFYDCSGLTSITIPNSVTSIGNSAFYGCSGLTSITIPNSVTSIGYRAFRGCSGLTSVTIPSSVTTIGEYAFYYCSGLTSVTIPESVTSIGNGAFCDCSGLTSITIGSGVTSIGYLAFSGCNSLTNVYCYAEQVPDAPGNTFAFPSAVLHVPATSVVAYRATAPWSSFGSIVPLEEESEDDTYINGIYYDFSDNEAKVIKGENAYSGDVEIPASVTYKGKSYNVTSIGDFAFFQCNGLTSVSIPESVTTIGQLAFVACSGLISINLPDSVTSIGVGAFAECTGLSLVSLPEGFTSISESLFSGCNNLTSITIPKNITIIGERAFAYCSKLKKFYSYAEQVPSTADNAFENTPIESAVLQVPTSSAKEQYKTTAPWSEFGSIIAQTDEEIAGDGPQLENSSFDDWHVVGSGTQALYNPWKEGSVSFWDTGNRGATTVGASNSTYGTEDGRTYANLQSKFIVIKFAAGNIFTGSYLKTDGTNGILSLGRPFTGRPTKLQFDYSYKTSVINRGGNKWYEGYSKYISKEAYDKMFEHTVNDSCCIWVALIGDKDEEVFDGVTYPFIIRTRPSDLHLFDPNSENVIAYGQFTSGDDQLEWGTRTIDIQYRNDRTPKYIIVVATSSKYGDYFVGGDASLLKLDNLKLLYDDPIPIEKETFFAELANGVQMEFGYISKDNRTCQVGSEFMRKCFGFLQVTETQEEIQHSQN